MFQDAIAAAAAVHDGDFYIPAVSNHFVTLVLRYVGFRRWDSLDALGFAPLLNWP